MVQKLTERKDHLLSEAEQDQKKNLKKIKDGRDSVSADVNELSAPCDQAEQEMQQEGVELVGQISTLPEVIGKYKGKAAPAPVQTQPAVFQPTDTPVPVLGHVKSGGTGHHQGNQKQVEKQPDKVSFGGRGIAPGKFKDPVGVAVSDEGEIFVADRGNKRIQVFTLQGTFVHEFKTFTPEYWRINPTDVALDGEGNLWVVGWTDSADFAVQFDKQSKAVRKIDIQKMGGRGVAVDTRRNHILITQTTGDWPDLHSEIQVLRPDGTLVRTVGQQQGMKEPCSVTADNEGRMYVSDRGNNCVFAFNEYGQFLLQFGEYVTYQYSSKITVKLNIPLGICTDREGNIIVADTDNNRVKMFDKTGRFVRDIISCHKQLWAVAMAIQGPLVVTDGWTDTVTIFNTF
ncbi:tripartite motif-containing protein 3-like [Branchiostoma lanceolatum]|uniref:tripartite motif-containing protein 3-like n=1 Tax=Branchiostoma lanceolatum TaxID=7740 RepID=UPI00345284C1